MFISMKTAQIHNLEMAETLNALAIDSPSTDHSDDEVQPKRWPQLLLMAGILGMGSAYVMRDSLPDQITAPAYAVYEMLNGTRAMTASPVAVPAPSRTVQTIEPQSAHVISTSREITGSGYVTAPQVITLYAPRADTISAVHFDIGDAVKAGDPLVELEGEQAQFALERASISKERAALKFQSREIELKQLRQSLAQTQKLADRGVVPLKQVTDEQIKLQMAENAIAQSRQELAQSDLELRMAQHAIDELTIRAPFAGTITDLRAFNGITTQEGGAREGIENSLLTLVNVNELYIDADFAERNISIFRDDVIVEAVLDAYPDQPFDIQLERIASLASAQKGTISARFHSINPPVGMRPNMAVRIRVTQAGSDNQTESE